MSNREVTFKNVDSFADWFRGRLRFAKTLNKGDMVAYVVRGFSPEMALFMADYNTRNRVKRPKRLKAFVRIIQAGKFQLTSQGLVMSDQDRLNDGQHRLEAIFDAGRKVDIRITFNEPDDAFHALDSGGVRSADDHGMQFGIHGARKMSAAVKIIAALESGNGRTTAVDMDPREVAEWLSEHTVMQEVFNDSLAITKALKSRLSGVLAALYLIRTANPALSQVGEFVEKLKHGAGMGENHPLLTLRNALIARRFDDPSKADGAQGVLTAAAIVLAWNRWVQGGTTMRWSTFTWDPAEKAFPVALPASPLPVRRAA